MDDHYIDYFMIDLIDKLSEHYQPIDIREDIQKAKNSLNLIEKQLNELQNKIDQILTDT